MQTVTLCSVFRVTCAMVVISILGCAVSSPFVRQHGDFTVHCATIKEVALIPANVTTYVVGVGGQRELDKLPVRRITADLTALIQQELSKRGFTVSELQESKDSLSDSDKPFRDADIAQLYQKIARENYQRPAQGNQRLSYECKLGDEAKRLAAFAHTDGLVFVSFDGYRRTGGSIAVDLMLKALLTAGLMPQDPTGVAELEVAFVDGTTGDVLWANSVGKVKHTFTTPSFERDDLEKMTQDLLKNFPKQ